MNSTMTSLGGSNTYSPGMIPASFMTLNGSPVQNVNFSLMPVISATVATSKDIGTRKCFPKWNSRTSS